VTREIRNDAERTSTAITGAANAANPPIRPVTEGQDEQQDQEQGDASTDRAREDGSEVTTARRGGPSAESVGSRAPRHRVAVSATPRAITNAP